MQTGMQFLCAMPVNIATMPAHMLLPCNHSAKSSFRSLLQPSLVIYQSIILIVCKHVQTVSREEHLTMSISGLGTTHVLLFPSYRMGCHTSVLFNHYYRWQ